MSSKSKAESKIKVQKKDPLNLSVHFDPRELYSLGQQCYDLYIQDDESRADWLAVHTKYLELYHQLDKDNNSYPEGFSSSDARVPLLTEACLGFQARAYKALFPQRSFVAISSLEDISTEEQHRAERLSKWLNYLLNIKNRRYKRDKKRMLLASALMGSDFSKTYPDPLSGEPKIERVRAQDFIVCYGTGPRELEDVRRKTHRISMDMNVAKKLYRNGFFTALPVEQDKTYESSGDMQQVEDEIEGLQDIGKEGKVALIIEQHTWYDLDGDGIEEPVIVWVCTNSKKVLRVAARYNINDQDKKPVEYFTHYPFIDNTDGFYGYGYGHLIANLNDALNQMLRNSLNAGELANSGNMGGFIAETAGIKGGEVEVPIGKFTKVPRTADDLSKAIYQMKFPGPNPTYVGLIEFMQSTIQRLSNTTEAVSGDVSKVYQPMTILTMLEQSLQMPSSIMENLALAMEGELEKIFKITKDNAETIQTFVEDKEMISVTQEDFQGAVRVYPIMDPRNITKQQKMAKSQSVYQLAATNPLIANDATAMYTVTKQVLESMEVQDIDLILKQPQNQEPERIDDQHEENMFFLMPPNEKPYFDVFADQDHETHIKIINELLRGLEGQQQATGKLDISPEGLQALMLHKQKHVAFLYGKMHGVFDGQGQLGNMEAAAGDEALLAALAEQLQLGGQPVGMPSGEGGAIPGTGGGAEGSGELPGEGVLGRVPLDQQNQ